MWSIFAVFSLNLTKKRKKRPHNRKNEAEIRNSGQNVSIYMAALSIRQPRLALPLPLNPPATGWRYLFFFFCEKS